MPIQEQLEQGVRHGNIEQPLPDDLEELFRESPELIQAIDQLRQGQDIDVRTRVQLAQDLAVLRDRIAHQPDTLPYPPEQALRRYLQVAELLFAPGHSQDLKAETTEALNALYAIVYDADYAEVTNLFNGQEGSTFSEISSELVSLYESLYVSFEAPVSLQALDELDGRLATIRSGIEDAKARLGDEFIRLASEDETFINYLYYAEMAMYRTETVLADLRQTAKEAADADAAADLLADIQGGTERSEQILERELMDEVAKHSVIAVAINSTGQAADYEYNTVNNGQNALGSRHFKQNPGYWSSFRVALEGKDRKDRLSDVLARDPLVHELVAARLLERGERMGDMSGVTTEPDEPAMVIGYSYTDTDYTDWAGRSNNDMTMNFFVPVALGQRLMQQIKKDPTFIRRLVDHSARGQMGFKEASWGVERDSREDSSSIRSMKPNYAAMHERLGGREQMMINEEGIDSVVRAVFAD